MCNKFVINVRLTSLQGENHCRRMRCARPT